MIRRTATYVLVAATLAALTPIATAGAAAAPAPAVVNPICELGPPGELVCETEASAQANASVGTYPGPCVQAYPYSELCDGAEAGLEAGVAGSGHTAACLQAEHHRACAPGPVQPDALP